MSPTPTAITIAGSDSGGGAGIQADLKAFARCGVHGTSAITALTAQSTTGVSAIHPVPPEMIVEQVRTVAADIRIDAAKVGMLGDRPTIEAVAEALDLLEPVPVVVDPVMVAESGAELLDPDARSALVSKILPRATVATPNLDEARALTGLDSEDPADLAAAVRALGPDAVIVTGGHADGVDVLDDGADLTRIPGDRHPDGTAHGSGCTHSSCVAALLARGAVLREAAEVARELAGAAVRDGLADVGSGAGPVDVIGLSRVGPLP